MWIPPRILKDYPKPNAPLKIYIYIYTFPCKYEKSLFKLNYVGFSLAPSDAGELGFGNVK